MSKKENLITIDFICHGVPSQRSFKKYLEEIKDTYGKGRDVSKVDFRSKSTGWEEFSMKIEFDSGEAYEKVHKKDAFSKAFLGDIMLRPSCYECTEKGVNRISDITIADAWCIGDYDEKIYNKKGTSLIIVHSNNGYKMINEIGKYIEQKELSENFIKKTSPNTYYSAIVDRRRRKFMELMAAGETFESSVDIALQCDRRINIERKIRSKYKGIKRRIKKQ